MNYSIQNQRMALTVSTRGAEMQSLKLDNREYLWQGDPRYWKNRATNLFPYVGRLTDDSWQIHGKAYPMIKHGFAKLNEFTLEKQDSSSMTFALHETDETMKMFPYPFQFRLTYTLNENTLTITAQVHNGSQDERMFFGYGAHPGFNCPLDENTSFEDYVLEFSDACHPRQVLANDAAYLTGSSAAYPLEDDRRIPLRHDLFDHDAVILEETSREVTLRSDRSPHYVKLSFPQMPYFAFWHANCTDAPYVCMEPWASLPSRADIVEEASAKSDLLTLGPQEDYTCTWSVTLG
jgi:galactose mutarotase-like enzyme